MFAKKDYGNESQHFITDKEYELGYDEEIQCMSYTGPDFEVHELCDAMKIESSIQTESISTWEQAKIVDEDNDNYIIKFLRDDDTYTRTIGKQHYRTLMFKCWTHTRANEWRYKIDRQLNMLVQIYDPDVSKWMSGRIMATHTNMDDTIDQVTIELNKEYMEMDTSLNRYPQLSIRSPLIKLQDGELNNLTL